MDTRGVAFKTALTLPTSSVISNFDRQFSFYKDAFDEDGDNVGKKFPVRTITIFNRLALVLDETTDMEVFNQYQSGGLLNQVRPPIVKQYRSLAETLEKTPVPQMLRGEDWELGYGVDIHLSITAVLDFHASAGHWPRLHDADDAAQVFKLAEKISDAHKEAEGGCWR